MRAPLRHSLSAFARPVSHLEDFAEGPLRAAERWTCGSQAGLQMGLFFDFIQLLTYPDQI
jgi:hypothetical protein